MIQTRIINEINQSYLEIIDSDSHISDDYRLKMLAENRPSCFIPQTVRCVDGISKDYYDISGKESLISFFSSKPADRNELTRLFKSMADATSEAEKLLIEEGNIIFRPECIFVDSKSKNYEFVCIPTDDWEGNLSLNISNLLQFFLSKLDDNDIDLLKTVYSLFDKSQSTGINSRSIFELFMEGITKNQKTEVIVPKYNGDQTDNHEVQNESEPRYIPSVKGIVALVCAITGLFLIGYQTYLIMLSNI